MIEQAQMSPSAEQFFPGSIFDAQGRLMLNKLRTNTTLRKQEWEELDLAIVDIARQRLVGVQDLRNSGLTLNLNGLGTTVSQFEKQSDMEAAVATMDVTDEGNEDALTFTLISIPVPITHKSFRIGARQLDASRRLGTSLDVSQATVASRRVTDKLEDTLFNGDTGINVNGQVLAGYTTHADRNTGTGSDWGTIGNIFTDVNGMVLGNEGDSYYGPYTLYVSTNQFGELRQIFTDGSGQSALNRVLQGIPSITRIQPADLLADGSALLVQMTRDVVDLAVGVDIQTIQWDVMGGLQTRFKVMAAIAPRIKSDAALKSGVFHITTI
jgi:uncharacterized linocin/CFP29 family protein